MGRTGCINVSFVIWGLDGGSEVHVTSCQLEKRQKILSNWVYEGVGAEQPSCVLISTGISPAPDPAARQHPRELQGGALGCRGQSEELPFWPVALCLCCLHFFCGTRWG